MLYIGEGDSKGGEVDSKFTFSELDLSVCVCVCVCLCLGSVSVSVCLSLCSVFVLGSVSAIYLQYKYQCIFVFTICLYFLSLLQYFFLFFLPRANILGQLEQDQMGPHPTEKTM